MFMEMSKKYGEPTVAAITEHLANVEEDCMIPISLQAYLHDQSTANKSHPEDEMEANNKIDELFPGIWVHVKSHSVETDDSVSSLSNGSIKLIKPKPSKSKVTNVNQLERSLNRNKNVLKSIQNLSKTVIEYEVMSNARDVFTKFLEKLELVQQMMEELLQNTIDVIKQEGQELCVDLVNKINSHSPSKIKAKSNEN